MVIVQRMLLVTIRRPAVAEGSLARGFRTVVTRPRPSLLVGELRPGDLRVEKLAPGGVEPPRADSKSRPGVSAHLGRSGSLPPRPGHAYVEKPAGIVTASGTLTLREAACEKPIQGETGRWSH